MKTLEVCSLHIESRIQYRYAHTQVRSQICNIAGSAQEVSFSMTLPDTAFISSLSIEIDGKEYNAYVKEKEEAQAVYNAALQMGRTAAHVAVSARDSNHFTVSVNVEPQKKVTFNLKYEELLNRKLGVYKHVINLDPGQIVPDLSIRVNIEESTTITSLTVPAIRSNDLSNPNKTEEVNTLATIERPSPHTAVVKFAPSPEQQQALSRDGIRGQFIVQYDVDRSTLSSQLLVNDGYFVHYFAPENLNPLPKHIIFVLDISGSMQGRKIIQLKEAMEKVLGDLRPEDYFSLVTFNSTVLVWRLIGDGEWHPPSVQETDSEHLVVTATSENKLKGKLAIHKLLASGNTNISHAMMVSTNIAQLGKRVETNSGSLEPIIIFLTDGQPTAGTCNTEEIVSETTRLNQISNATIFALGLGNDVDFEFLKKLALRNSGFSRKIYEASDAALQLTDFYKEVSSPLLSNVTFIYQPEQVTSASLTKQKFVTFYLGSELVVTGCINPSIAEQDFCFSVTGKGCDGMRNYSPKETQVMFLNKADFMERLWAYLTIQQLLEEEKKLDGKFATEKRKQATSLALKYSFVTPVTSLVVVRPDDDKNQSDFKVQQQEDDEEDSDRTPIQPQFLNFGSSNQTCGFGQPVRRFAARRTTDFLSKLSGTRSGQAPSSLFSAPASCGSFGSSNNLPASTFGQPSSSLFSAQPSSGSFGSSNTLQRNAFGQPPSSFFSAQQSSGSFGYSNTLPGSVFGQQSGSLFSAQPSSVSFGSSNALPGSGFGQPLTGLSPAQPINFGFGSSNQTTGFGFDQSLAPNMKKHFSFNKNDRSCVCNHCNSCFIPSVPEDLTKHMDTAHPGLLTADLHQHDNLKQVDDSQRAREINIMTCEEQIVDACVEMVIMDGIPLSVLDGSGFKKLIDPIITGLKNPVFTITGSLIRKEICDKYSDVEEKIRQVIKNTPICLKLDVAMELQHMFLAIHVCYIQSGKLVTNTLSMQEINQKNYRNYLRDLFLDIFNKYGLTVQNLLYITIDSDNIFKHSSGEAISDCDYELEAEGEKQLVNCLFDLASEMGIPAFRSPDYTLQLAINNALDTEKTTVVNVKEAVGKLKSSITKLNNISKRWHATYSLLESFWMEISIQPDLFQQEEDKKILQSILGCLKILNSFHEALHEKPRLFGEVYSLWTNKQEDISKIGTAFADILSACMKNKATEVLQNPVILAAIFLDPQHKELLDEDQKTSAIEELIKIWKRVSINNGLTPTSEEEIKEKLKVYSTAFQTQNEEAVLEFWESQKQQQPELYTLSSVILAVTAVQNTAQRLFSCTDVLSSFQPDYVKHNIVTLRCSKLFDSYAV